MRVFTTFMISLHYSEMTVHKLNTTNLYIEQMEIYVTIAVLIRHA